VSDSQSRRHAVRARIVQIDVLALVGTRKGLFMLRSDDERRRWRTEGPLLAGWGIFHAIGDTARRNHLRSRQPCRLRSHRSTDGGATCKRSQQIGLPEKSGMILEATWHIAPGPPEAPGTLYLGGAPADAGFNA
jgi:hypothetical protein